MAIFNSHVKLPEGNYRVLLTNQVQPLKRAVEDRSTAAVSAMSVLGTATATGFTADCENRQIQKHQWNNAHNLDQTSTVK